jgi:ribosome biogenesis GTPase / thiamine phosphate phosphatase
MEPQQVLIRELMTKAKLTVQQRRRIRDKQSRASAAVGKKEDRAGALLSSSQLGQEKPGLVIARYNNQADVVLDSSHESPVKRCYFRAHLDSLVSGDRVMWRDGNPFGVVCSVLPRTSQLDRPDAAGKVRTVVANVDLVVIIVAPEPLTHTGLIDRYLVACEHHEVSAIIVVNKIDLTEAEVTAVQELVAPYANIGYPVLSVSAKTAAGLDQLSKRLETKTSVLVGQSGVGKSSLINAICPPAEAKVGALSGAKLKGRHTTSAAHLFTLPSGARIIDSPGIREFDLIHLPQQQLVRGFTEFRPYLGRCHFRNCRHIDEPDCALRTACDHNEITSDRLDSFRRISQQLEN